MSASPASTGTSGRRRISRPFSGPWARPHHRVMDDVAHMRAALGLARRALGSAWPNPAVGCVIVSAAGRVVGRGATAPGGRPHAETVALAMAGPSARGGTAYVTLEPCAHWGETPPCANALVDAGIARVVIGAGDPDARVNGQGIGRLLDAGVEVATRVLETEAKDVGAGFLTRMTAGRPLVTLKLASTLDGRIATASGDSHWITAEPARRMAHALREAGLTRVMVEGGAQLAAAFLRDGLVDRIAWFHAPSIIGGDGVPAAAAFDIEEPSAAPRFVRRSIRPDGDDVLTELAAGAA